MSKFKTTLVVAALSSTVAFGGAMAAKSTSTHNDNVRYGVAFNYNSALDSSYGAGVVAKNHVFEAGVDVGIVRTSDTDEHSTAYLLNGYFGVRQALRSHVYASVGVMGGYAFLSDIGSFHTAGNSTYANRHPYDLGAYVGLAYEPNNNVQFFARIMPVNYGKDVDNTDVVQFFMSGQAGVAYFF